jgi:hypothetical protein
MPGRAPGRARDRACQARTGVGSVLAATGALSILLSQVLGWTELPGPWSSLIGMASGLATGTGCVLALRGLARLGRDA